MFSQAARSGIQTASSSPAAECDISQPPILGGSMTTGVIIVLIFAVVAAGVVAWGGEVSTEDLRVTLQRYRSFFTRILSV
jgi:hypothetical protein